MCAGRNERRVKEVVKFFGPCAACSVLILFFAGSSWGTTAEFNLQLAAGESDAVIDVGETLNLEIWVDLAGDPLPIDLVGYTFFARPSADATIDYVDGSFSSVYAANPVSLMPIGTDNKLTDNSDLSGAFARGPSFDVPVAGLSGAVKLASFAVEGLAQGQVDYYFGTDGLLRDWWLTYDAGFFPEFATVSQGAPLQITVTPEPTVASCCLLMGSLWLTRRQRRLAR